MQKNNFYTQLYHWYDQNKRILPWRETEDPYRIWVSEIILQQTRVDQGMPYYMRFIERFPSWQSLAAAPEDEVLRYWQGLGYYSRARNMHKAAVQLQTNNVTHFPDTYEGLRALPGIGEYTAGAITAFAYNLPHPALDGNVYRVLARLTDCEIAFDTSVGKKHFHAVAEDLLDQDNPRLFDSAIMEFGALYCVPTNPDCEQCVLQLFCKAYAHHTVALLPVRKPRPKVRDRYFNYTIYLSEDNNHLYTLIHQRQERDIWHHLWEFPLEESEALLPITDAPYLDLTHLLSHQRLHARFTVRHVKKLPAISGTQVIKLSDMDDYAFSRLSLNALHKLGL